MADKNGQQDTTEIQEHGQISNLLEVTFFYMSLCRGRTLAVLLSESISDDPCPGNCFEALSVLFSFLIQSWLSLSQEVSSLSECSGCVGKACYLLFWPGAMVAAEHP